ncbi:mitochondrial precursor protein [Ascodesmis nigricans]|uniref:Mitochondrial protein n=1 Tax=Ascodesmis nigricans TaxID=341454 RepID=A0A4V3SHK3_9PEZI|nr:mitochondrial precursor protein [Ascodesmis nigricans]
MAPPSAPATPLVHSATVANSSSPAAESLWSRVSNYVSEHKVAVFTIGAVVVVAGAGGIYYISQNSAAPAGGESKEKKAKKDRRRRDKDVKEGSPKSEKQKDSKASVSDEAESSLPEVNETTVEALSQQQRLDYAAKLKAAGNEAYGQKNYQKAIDLYTKAILCKKDPIYYSNRSACWNALSEWEKVVDDTTAAIALDPEYVKALNRRASAYEQLEKYSEALLDFTASCIIDGFRNEASAQSVERLLKKVAEAKGRAMLAGKTKKLPSPTFVSNYLQSFRPRAPPAGLADSDSIDEGTGDHYLRAGLQAIQRKTADAYEEAGQAFDKAMELGTGHEALALNWRGTFKYLRGDSGDALADLTKSIELDPKMTQSYIKRASMSLELGDRDAAAADFEAAIEHNPDDADIYYHRAQLHFICGEFAEAAKDYQKSIELDRDFIFSHIQLGVTQYKQGSIASSMATFRRCIKNFEKVPDVYNYFGELLLDQQKFQEAIEKFDLAIEMEKQTKPMGMNVLPLINKALALFQWKQDYAEAEKLCEKALLLDPDCDIAVATMAQLLLQQGKVDQALQYFEQAAKLARTEAEIVNALSYAEATRTQLQVQEKYPQLASRLQGMAGLGGR